MLVFDFSYVNLSFMQYRSTENDDGGSSSDNSDSSAEYRPSKRYVPSSWKAVLFSSKNTCSQQNTLSHLEVLNSNSM